MIPQLKYNSDRIWFVKNGEKVMVTLESLKGVSELKNYGQKYSESEKFFKAGDIIEINSEELMDLSFTLVTFFVSVSCKINEKTVEINRQ